MFKKLFLVSSVVLCLTACTEDYTNWVAPDTTVSITQQDVALAVTGVSTPIDLATVTDETVQVIKPEMTNGVTETYSIHLTEGSKTWTLNTDFNGYASVADLTSAIKDLYNSKPEMRTLKGIVTATAKGINAEGNEIVVEVSAPEVTFQAQIVPPAFEQYLWMPGNGNDWNHDVCPVLACNDGDGVYHGYAYINGDFKFNYDNGWNGRDFGCSGFDSSDSNFDVSAGGGNNISATCGAGLYFMTVDLVNKSIAATPAVWSLIGNFNSWAGDVDMVYNEADHCLVADGVALTEGWKFRLNHDWGTNLGGDLDNLVANGGDISIVGTKVKLYVERINEGYKATVE